MSHTKPDIIKSFLPIFYISKFFGCNLYPLPSPLNATNIKASLTAIDILFCVFQFAFYIFVIFPLIEKWGNYNSIFDQEFASHSGSSGLLVIIFIGRSLSDVIAFTNLLIIIMDMRNSAIFRKILFSFIKFDEKMLKLGVKVDSNKRISLLYVVIVIIWQILTISLSLLIAKATNDSGIIFITVTFIGHSVNVGCIYSYLTTFWYVLVNLAERFVVINNCLRTHLQNKRDRYSSEYGSSTTHIKKQFLEDNSFVGNLSRNHMKLVGIVSELSKLNALQLICCTAIVFLNLIVTTFIVYQRFMGDLKDDTPVSALFYGMRGIHYILLLYKVIAVGSKIRKQRNIALSLINKAISLEQNKFMSNQLNHFSYQVEHSNTTISCGLFTMDWTLIYTLTTASTTYLLLFMQFNSISTKNF